MTTVPLGEVVSLNPRDVAASDEEISFVGMAQLDAETATASPLESRRFAEVSKGYTVFRDGDLLAAKITPCWENGKIGQAKLAHRVGVGSTEFHVLRPGPSVHDRYLLHFLRLPDVRATGELRMTGSAGQRRVPSNFLRTLGIPLPPLPEQRRIAAILDHADALRAKRLRALAHLDALPQAIFHDMFGDPRARQWRFAPLGELVAHIESGSSPNCEAREAEPDEWGVLKLGAVTYGRFREGENKAYLGDLGRMTANEVRRGDVLMTRKNTRELVGAVALVEDVRPRLLLPDLIFRLRLDPTHLDPRYFQAFMMNPRTRPMVRDLSSGSASSMPNISKTRLLKLSVALPPLQLQREFAARVETIETQRTRVESTTRADDELFASLQSRAFRGEL